MSRRQGEDQLPTARRNTTQDHQSKLAADRLNTRRRSSLKARRFVAHFAKKCQAPKRLQRFKRSLKTSLAEKHSGSYSHATLANWVSGTKLVLATTPGFTACFWKVISL